MDYITQIILQIIIAAATITAAHITAKNTIKKELIKLNYAKTEKLNNDFSQMCANVTAALDHQNKSKAQQSVCALRSHFSGDLSETLDNLQKSLNYHDSIHTQQLLDKAISEYRMLVHTDLKTSKRRKPSR